MSGLRIAAISLHPLDVPMARPIKMAGETLHHAQTLLACVHDEAGRCGWGEAAAAPLMTGETLDTLLEGASRVAGGLLGCNVQQPAGVATLLARLLPGRPSVHAVFETALLDLFAQRAGQPLHRLLRSIEGAAADPSRAAADDQAPRLPSLPMLHMLASGDLEAERAEAAAQRARGVRHWKIKVGAADVALDAHRVAVLCDDLRGDAVSADANMALTPAAASRLAQVGVRHGLAFLEQPFGVGDLTAAAELHRGSGLALCADESIRQCSDIEAHHAARAAQGASLKLIKLGGTLALLQAGRLCLRLGWHVNLACKVAETTVSAAATAHAGFALGAVAWVFSMSSRYLAQDVCASPLQAHDGAVDLAQLAAPGLGFVPEPARLRAFASPGRAALEFFG